MCSYPKPELETECENVDCPASWAVGDWSQVCSVSLVLNLNHVMLDLSHTIINNHCTFIIAIVIY